MRRLAGCVVVLFLLVARVQAYVDISPSLGALIKQAESISLVEVDKVSQEKKIVIYKKVADLKGQSPDGNLRHHVEHGYHPREPKIVLDWATPGQQAVCFTTGRTSIFCLGQYWYQVTATQDSWWTMVSGRPELSLAYFGYVERLTPALKSILAGKEVIIPIIDHGARFGVYQYENVAFQKVLRGRECPVCRVRASLQMPEKVWQVSDKDSPWVVGPGAAGLNEVRGLIQELSSENARTRRLAADDLGLVGPKAQAAIEPLRKLYDDPDKFVRIAAARAVSLINEERLAPVKVLVTALADEQIAVRKAACEAIGDLNDEAVGAVSTLAETLHDTEQSVRWSAAEALSRIGPGAEASIPALAMALRDPTIRVMAADALGSMGLASRGAAPLLIDALQDADIDFKWTSAIALTRIDPKSAKAAMPLFIERLKSNDLRARWDSMMYVAPMGLEAIAAADAVREIVKRGNGVGATTLAAIAGPDGVDAMPLLLHVLADDWDTSDSMAKIGPAAVPFILKAMQDRKSTSRHLMIKALGFLAARSPDAVKALVAELKDEDPKLRAAAATALGDLDQADEPTLRALQALLDDPEPTVQLAAVATLRWLSVDGVQRINRVVVDLLAHSRPEIRREAVKSLADFGAIGFKQAAVLLDEAIKDTDPHVRSSASRTLAIVAAAHYNNLAVDEMIEALKESDPQTRVDAAKFLGTLGRDARGAVDALNTAKLDEIQEVRDAATEALVLIKGKRKGH